MTHSAPPKPQLLRHVVLFQFKSSVKQAEVQEVIDAFAAIAKKDRHNRRFRMGAPT